MRNKKSNYYWTKEHCQEEALKYKTRLGFQRGSGSSWAYRVALENDWIDDVCAHMETCGNKYKRCIYVYEFSDNFAYIGLTYNLENRSKIHLKKGPVYRHLKINSNYNLKKLTDYIDVNKAKVLEGKFLNKYKKEGWNILNKFKTGGIGNKKLYWNKENCQKEALKYRSRKEFQIKCSSAYNSSRNHKWLDEVCSHMFSTLKHKGFWTKDKCKEIALKYKTRKEFLKNDVTVYNICVRNNWLDYVCSHTNEKSKNPIGYWTKEVCQKEALKYNLKKDFRKYSLNHYSASVRNKWINEVCSHMKNNKYYDKRTIT